MVLPDIRLLQAAIVLAEELHFSRAADRLHIGQSTLSKQIFRLEDEIGFQLFVHNHQVVEITDAGRVFVEEAREAVFHTERAVLSGRAVANGADDLLNLGKSAYTDPFLISTLLSVHLPLFPGMKVKVWSNFSNELAQQVIAGTLDVAVITGVPDTSKLHLITITDNPFYIAMSMEDELAAYRELRWSTCTIATGCFSATMRTLISTTLFRRSLRTKIFVLPRFIHSQALTKPQS